MSKEKKTGMRYVTVPAPANVEGLLNVKELSFEDFFADMVLPKIPKKTMDGTKVAKRLIGKILECKVGDVIEFTDEEHEALIKALPEELPGRLQVKTIDHFDAITSAASEPPKKEAEAEVEEAKGAENGSSAKEAAA